MKNMDHYTNQISKDSPVPVPINDAANDSNRTAKEKADAKKAFGKISKELEKFRKMKQHFKSSNSILTAWINNYSSVHPNRFFGALDDFEDNLLQLYYGSQEKMK